MGAKISKRYSVSYKSQPKVFILALNFPPNGPHKTFGIFQIFSFRFLTIFFPKFQIYYCSPGRNQKPLLSGKQATVEQKKLGVRQKELEIWDSQVVVLHI